jgi:Icc-related predicted phosphoesterase
MKLCAIADLHGRLPAVEPCDVLLLAGDVCPDLFGLPWGDPSITRVRQEEWLRDVYAPWEAEIPARHILMTPGNHDWISRLPEGLRTVMMIDAGCTIEGLNFWATPWIEEIGFWNYQAPRAYRREAFAEIPVGLDVLIAHSPAFGVLDKTYGGDHAGCPELRSAVYRAQPRVMVHGHIHEGRRWNSAAHLGPTRVYNVAMISDTITPTTFFLDPQNRG